MQIFTTRIITIIIAVLLYNIDVIAQNPKSQNGVIDLRQTSFQNRPIKLSGNWKMFWKQYITNADTASVFELIPFPQRFDQTILQETALPAQGYATYALTVLLPQKNKEQLSLLIPDVYTAHQLFINGKLFFKNGTVGKSATETQPYWEMKLLPLPINDTLKIILQVANFHHAKGGPFKDFEIGKSEVLERAYTKSNSLDFILAGCFIMGGIFFLALYFFGQKDKATLYFSLFCITYAYRIVGSGSYILHHILEDTSWFLTTKLEYISLCLSIYFLILYIRYQYPKDSPRIVMHITGLFSLAFFFIILFTEPIVYTGLLNYYLVVMFFNVILGMYVYIKAFKNKREGAIYSLLSIVVILTIFTTINLAYFGFIEPQQILISLGYMVFLFLQALILAFRFSYKLKQAKSLAEQGLKVKTEFLSTMSHEIRTPLNSVIGLSHLLLKNEPRKDQIRELETLLFSANNLLNIVNDILDFNKIEAGKLHFEKIEMDIKSIASNIVGGMKISAEDKGIELRLQIDTAIQHQRLVGDPTRLTQVLANLLNNAIKFTNDGYVLLALKLVNQTAQNVSIQFIVEDTGIGIPSDKHEEIFNRFTQADSSTSRRFGGTGLGLAISKKIVQAQNSSIQLESELGKGSRFSFTIRFPYVADKSTTEIKQAETYLPINDKTKPLSKVNILLVEDNMINVFVAQSFLVKWGALIDVAKNGQEALDMLDVNKHKIVLMDLHMPIMDGYEATKIMRANGVSIPIIALTASLPKEVEHQIIDLGITDIVVKPFVPDDLFRVLLLHLQK